MAPRGRVSLPSSGARTPRTPAPPVVVLGQVGVVSSTQQADVSRTVVSTQAKRVPMVILEAVALRAPSARLVPVMASVSVTLAHRSAAGGRDEAGGGRGIGRRRPLSWPAGLGR